MMETNRTTRIIRYPDVMDRLGLSRNEIGNRVRAEEEFPKPVPLGKRAVGFIEAEIDQYIERLMSARPAAEVAR